MDRVQKRREKQQQQQTKEDRDKTLEPVYPKSSLMKSATSAQIPSHDAYGSTQKERTPYRLQKNKYLDSDYGSTSSASKRSEIGSQNGFDSSYSSQKLKSSDSGYFEHKRDKENIYKSKYDPDIMLSEAGKPSKEKRAARLYKRNDSQEKRKTAVDLYDMLEDSSKGSRYRQTRRSAQAAKPRSETQRFFELEDMREDPEKTERETKRQEIQSLIMKYAQIDDFYGKSTIKEDEKKDSNNNTSAWDTSAYQAPVVIPPKTAGLMKSQTTANVTNLYGNSGRLTQYQIERQQSPPKANNFNNYSQSNHVNHDKYDRYDKYNDSGKMVTINTPNHVNTPRTRTSKALSTFVRIVP